MTVEPPRPRRPSRRRSRVRAGRLLAALALLIAVFLLGIALGEAIHDNPKPGGTLTFVRTLPPLPPARESGTSP